ncbi:DUF2511 domain-containing protein [Candidatus Palauibacter sp.]|uniref:DUF2511 domain-containing protein n=1 Tax=Candidatus Palauibacter sp. TaxID=3101350 RepID=UPI003B02B29E
MRIIYVVLVCLGAWVAVVMLSPAPPENAHPESTPPEGTRQRQVTQKEFGDAWPLIVESGVLRCEGDAVTFTAGQTYALNGVAMSRGLPEIEPIWAWREETLGSTLPLRKNISTLRFAGLDLCE